MSQHQIGRYHILRKLGKGGMGSVYKALVPIIDKVVAIKILEPFEVMEDVLGYDRLKEIFTLEAQTMADLHHSSVVKVWDYDEDEEGRPFFVMEFFCNNLGDIIAESFQLDKQSRRIAPDKVLYYGNQLLEGLSFIHYQNIVHRDIKPQNILVTDDDTIKICDFGMSLIEGISFCSPDTMQVGSPYYAAPEQNRNPNSVDHRADLFSTGVLLYRMLTGELPSMRNFSLSLVNPLFDRAWDDFFAQAINWDPDRRYQSATEMLTALHHLHIHWKKVVENSAGNLSKKGFAPVNLRKKPANICGERARKLFSLNELNQPDTHITNHFIDEGEDIIRDTATGLVWKRSCSKYGLTWQDAVSYVSRLKREQCGGRKNWRLPTVNELFSLYDDQKRTDNKRLLSPREKWLWSSDQHGKRDAWYVNLDLGYAEWQDVTCLNFVKAVSD